MNKSEISKEILSQIKLELDETLFYMPGETIKGIIKLSPGVKFSIKNNIIHFKLKLIQYEFWDYSNIKLTELKNIYKTEIKENMIDFKLNEDETNKIDNENFMDFSIIQIESKENRKEISIPFEFKIDENNQKLLPTFQFTTEKYFLGIRHLLLVECKEYCSINHIGLFIGKLMDNNLLKEKEIKSNYYMGLGSLNAKIIIPKQTYYFGEEMPFNIESNSNLLFKKVTKIEPDLNRKIEWVGYMKNSLLDKKSMPIEDFSYNEDKHALVSKLLLPFVFKDQIDYFGCFGFGGVFGILGIFMLLDKLAQKSTTIREILRLDGQQNEFIENDIIMTKFNKSIIKECKKKELEEISEEFKKYVYFKDNKVIGFVKFIRDITPPVKGYYFNCDFEFKINIHISGIILDQNKTLKCNIDFYDGEDYIKKMKSLLRVY